MSTKRPVDETSYDVGSDREMSPASHDQHVLLRKSSNYSYIPEKYGSYVECCGRPVKSYVCGGCVLLALMLVILTISMLIEYIDEDGDKFIIIEPSGNDSEVPEVMENKLPAGYLN